MKSSLLLLSFANAFDTWVDGPTFTFKKNDLTKIDIEATVPNNMFLTLDFGFDQVDRDRIFLAGKDVGNCLDYFGYTKDESNDVSDCTWSKDDGIYSFKLTRKLETSDTKNDKQLSCGPRTISQTYDMEWTGAAVTSILGKGEFVKKGQF